MPTVKEVLNDTKKRLKEQGIDTYSLDSSLLVSEVTGLTKIQLVTHDRDEVTEEQINRLENLVKEFEENMDCNLDENSVWNDVIKRYFQE